MMAGQSAQGEDLPLIAYPVTAVQDMPIVVAQSQREWMNATTERFANHCLPLLMANQSGWLVLNSCAFVATWNGSDGNDSVELEYLTGAPPYPASSHFGYGIITWHIPYLFRTPPGFNLLVRGPANMPKDGVAPLEGLVETDWAVATFTMNWKITRPRVPIPFDAGEPICMLVPQRRADLNAFAPSLRHLAAEPDLSDEYGRWSSSRMAYYRQQPANAEEELAKERDWQRHYFRGRSPGRTVAPEHLTRFRLRPFTSDAAGQDGGSTAELSDRG
jgi:hypothetical protein